MKKLLALLLLSPLAYADVGDWSKSFYVDEFGDETNDGFISQTVKGKFSNSATENSPLRVRMFINNANVMENTPWFRLYEYDGRNPIKGVYSQNGMRCRIKHQDNTITELPIIQNQGSDYFTPRTDGFNEYYINIYRHIILNE